MQIFRYDDKSLQYIKLSQPKIILTVTILIMVLMLLLSVSKIKENQQHPDSYEKVILVDSPHQFTEKKLQAVYFLKRGGFDIRVASPCVKGSPTRGARRAGWVCATAIRDAGPSSFPPTPGRSMRGCSLAQPAKKS